ncbi:Histidine ABC transporter, histidine-binding periplasmic protein precursor HisJ (TC 3.A.1.3.1) (plasmid) [Klebsiella aerogenes]|nr:Histidine ABC transporter, histidine-binding periplasmic protein precursor HisJ (TC 3.A.1.3.1) [Klebsiella aerogenes]
MKKSLLLCLALMASTSALAAGAKEIRFGVDPTFAPFEWKDPQGKLAGFDIDFGQRDMSATAGEVRVGGKQLRRHYSGAEGA